jgi:hypothetical protein
MVVDSVTGVVIAGMVVVVHTMGVTEVEAEAKDLLQLVDFVHTMGVTEVEAEAKDLLQLVDFCKQLKFTEMIFEGNINNKSHANDGLSGKCDKLGGHPVICCMLQTYSIYSLPICYIFSANQISLKIQPSH